MNKNFKDLRKAAFAIGFGVCMGQYAAKELQKWINALYIIPIEVVAKHGNKAMQDVCKAAGVEYDKESSSTDKNEIKMGFQCQ